MSVSRRALPAVIAVSASALWLSPAAATQMTMHVIPEFGEGTVTVLAAVDDIDGDGAHDLLVGRPFDSSVASSAGSARLYSGRDGCLLLDLHGTAPSDMFGRSLAGAGDVDGDGVSDLIVGGPGADYSAANAGRVWLVSGADGSTILTVDGAVKGESFGSAVASIRDLDADGVADVVVGAPSSDQHGTDSGRVVLFSGATGRVLLSVVGEAAGTSLGSSVAGIGDVDGDGRADFAVLATDPRSGFGHGRVLSGADGSMLVSLDDGVGIERLHEVQDVDGDGIRDILGVLVTVAVTVFSSATGEPLLVGGLSEHLLYVASGDIVGDVDGDAVPDLAVGFNHVKVAGRIDIYSGADTERRILSFDANWNSPGFGTTVLSLGDVDGDGLPDLGSGTKSQDVRVLSSAVTPWTAHFGGISGGSSWPWSMIEPLSSLEAGVPIQMLLVNSVPRAPAFLVVGTTHVDLPLKGGTLHPSPDIVIPAGLSDASGQLKLVGHWPPGVPSGFQLTCQWWLVHAAGPHGYLASGGTTGTVP